MPETHIIYDEKRIIPAPPSVTIQKRILRTGDGLKIGSIFDIVVTGTLVAYKGSPDSNGDFWTLGGYPSDETITETARLGAILRKQEAIRKLFTNEGRLFEIQSGDGSTSLKFYPRLQDIKFQEGIWVDRCDYIITMEADKIEGAAVTVGSGEDDEESNYLVSEVNEAWAFEEGETPDTFRISHSVSARGRPRFETDGTGTIASEAWEEARGYVIDYASLAYDSSKVQTALPGAPSGAFSNYNHLRFQNVDERGGTYSITQSWIYAQRNYLEDFTVRVTNGLQRIAINVEGTITGLFENGPYDTIIPSGNLKFTNAQAAWNTVKGNLYTRAKAYSNDGLITSGTVLLNAVPSNNIISMNPGLGIITYNYEYDTRPTACLSNAKGSALMTNVVVVDYNQGDIFAEIPIPGRTLGPILQNINTKTAKRRQVTIDATFPVSNDCYAYGDKPNTDTYIQQYNPKGVNAGPSNSCYKQDDRESWTPTAGQYSRDITWTYE